MDYFVWDLQFGRIDPTITGIHFEIPSIPWNVTHFSVDRSKSEGSQYFRLILSDHIKCNHQDHFEVIIIFEDFDCNLQDCNASPSICKRPRGGVNQKNLSESL